MSEVKPKDSTWLLSHEAMITHKSQNHPVKLSITSIGKCVPPLYYPMLIFKIPISFDLHEYLFSSYAEKNWLDERITSNYQISKRNIFSLLENGGIHNYIFNTYSF